MIASPVEDELLIYDLDRELGHRLDPVAAAVWRECDGTRTVAELGEAAGRELGREVDEASVLLGLRLLAEADLLEEPEQVAKTGISRREAIVRVGVAVAMLPVVETFAVPTPAEAQSNGVTGPTGATGETGPTGSNGD